jgi:predicted ATPase
VDPSAWRDDVIDALLLELPFRRFITIVGPGGIGKTTVALALANVLLESYRDGVWLVELAALRDPDDS